MRPPATFFAGAMTDGSFFDETWLLILRLQVWLVPPCIMRADQEEETHEMGEIIKTLKSARNLEIQKAPLQSEWDWGTDNVRRLGLCNISR